MCRHAGIARHASISLAMRTSAHEHAAPLSKCSSKRVRVYFQLPLRVDALTRCPACVIACLPGGGRWLRCQAARRAVLAREGAVACACAGHCACASVCVHGRMRVCMRGGGRTHVCRFLRTRVGVLLLVCARVRWLRVRSCRPASVCAGKIEGREIRTPNLLIWSQTRYRCAIPPLMAAVADILYWRKTRTAAAPPAASGDLRPSLTISSLTTPCAYADVMLPLDAAELYAQQALNTRRTVLDETLA